MAFVSILDRPAVTKGRRWRTIGVLVLAMALVAGACGGDDDANDEDATTTSAAASATTAPPTPTGPSGSIVVAQSSDVLTLDASQDTSPISLNVFKHIFDQLTDIKADGSVAPLLAESWESDDATTWDFTIRSNALFHDGSPVTIEDVVWSFEKIMGDDATPVQNYVRSVTSVEAVDDSTIRFVLSSPFAAWPRQMSLVSIMPKKVYEEMGEDAFSQAPIGSGAFVLKEWVKDDRVVLEAFDDYWDGPPAVKTVTFRPVPSEAARVAGFESGELDIVPLLPPLEVPRLQALEGRNVELVESNRNVYVGFNLKPPTDNQKLRQAIDIAIDRDAITQQLLGGLGTPTGQPVAKVTFGYDPDLAAPAFDPEGAKALIAESGYSGEEIVITYPNNRYAFGTEVMEAVAGFLQNVGINVKLEGMEYSAFFPLWRDRTIPGQMHLFAYGPSIMDAQLPLGSLYESGTRGYWENPDIDELIRLQRGEADSEARLEIIHDIFAQSSEFVPYSWMYTEIQAYGINARVSWTPRPDERLFVHEASVND